MGYEDFEDIFFFFGGGGGGHHKIRLYLGVISMHLRVFFLRSRYRMGDIFWVANVSNIFRVLEIPDIVWGYTVDTGPEPTYEEKMRVPPGVQHPQ